jgi:hypothetical protein
VQSAKFLELSRELPSVQFHHNNYVMKLDIDSLEDSKGLRMACNQVFRAGLVKETRRSQQKTRKISLGDIRKPDSALKIQQWGFFMS